MKKGRFFRQMGDFFIKISVSFSIVLILYYFSKKIDNFAYDYFLFPSISITVIFLCGVNVGRSLERIKNNEKIGFLTKNDSCESESKEITEFIVSEKFVMNTNKKVIEDKEETIHKKVLNYDDNI